MGRENSPHATKASALGATVLHTETCETKGNSASKTSTHKRRARCPTSHCTLSKRRTAGEVGPEAEIGKILRGETVARQTRSLKGATQRCM